MRGVVTRTFPDKGFAFVRGTDGVSRFVHASWCRGLFDMLREGTEVDFTPGEGPRGPKADAIEILFRGEPSIG